jgi:hypothetical protein
VYEPAAQDVQDAVFPASAFDVPAGQTVQAPASVLAVAPAFANLPEGHVFAVNVKQAVPPVEYVPESQEVQSPGASLPAGEEEPAAQEFGQAVASVLCPVSVPYLPAAHKVHDD